VFVADGNFKADHVRQTKPSKDVWLSEGMVPKRQEYFAFLKSAMERFTVRFLCDTGADSGPASMVNMCPDSVLESTLRKYIPCDK